MIGKTLLHYEVRDSIGKGGMGEVFRARDTKLGRDVALKILPAELSGDPEREARFQREARALASLQHPNVASVYGFEEAEGARFLVMELITGSELTERMQRGPIPVEDTLNIARQIAAGLEAAHENGIVHRDLKPANIMETHDGEVKILDFGLAQAWFGDSDTQQESATAPTMTAAMTQMGAILGTAAYMSPEQARGVNVDRRTDIWAFGVILFEMLTGKQLFKGETISDTLAAVLRAEPEWDSLPVAEAPELCRLIERCLERNPKMRLRDIGEARIFLQDGGASISNLSFSQLGISDAPAAEGGRRKPPVVLMISLALLCLLAGTYLGWQVLARPEPAPVLHTMLPPPPDMDYDLKGVAPGPAVLSPDGTMVAFTAGSEGETSQIYLRHLDQGESVPMAGTEGADYPFWSPDSKYIGFFVTSVNKLKKIAVSGGPPVSLCVAEDGKGGSWNTGGQILFAATASTGISIVPAIGGESRQLTTLGEGVDSHRHPRFLPDGEQYIFTARTAASGEDNEIYLASLDTTITPRLIASSAANAEYSCGHLLTVREGVLMATPFDPSQERVVEGGTPLVENVLTIPGAAIGVFSAIDNGMIVFQTGVANVGGQQLFWTDLDTGGSTPLGEVGQVFNPKISPDGTMAVVEAQDLSDTGTDLWLVDLASGLRSRFTFAVGDEVRPCWTPDSKFVLYSASEGDITQILQQPVEGVGGTRILLENKGVLAPQSVSTVDQTLLIDFGLTPTTGSLRRLALDQPETEPEIVLADSNSYVGGGQYSPDGRWIAFHKSSRASWDVFVMSAAGGDRKWQVTTEGAVYPRWNPTGDKLWVSRFNGDLVAYEVDGRSATFRVGPAKRMVTISAPDVTGPHYDLDPAGGRLLQAGPDPAYTAKISYLHLVTDWRRGLTR